MVAMIIGTISVILGACVLPFALDKLLSDPPNGSPGPGLGFTLLAVSAGLIITPVLAGIIVMIIKSIRQYNAWMRTLTPGERLAVHLAEAAAMEAAHIAMRDRNRREDARLSESVIGIRRTSYEGQDSF